MQCPVESPRLFFAGIPLCAVSLPEIPCLSPAAVPSRTRDLLPGRRAGPCCMRKNRPAAWLFKRFPMEGFPMDGYQKNKMASLRTAKRIQ